MLLQELDILAQDIAKKIDFKEKLKKHLKKFNLYGININRTIILLCKGDSYEKIRKS